MGGCSVRPKVPRYPKCQVKKEKRGEAASHTVLTRRKLPYCSVPMLHSLRDPTSTRRAPIPSAAKRGSRRGFSGRVQVGGFGKHLLNRGRRADGRLSSEIEGLFPCFLLLASCFLASSSRRGRNEVRDSYIQKHTSISISGCQITGLGSVDDESPGGSFRRRSGTSFLPQ
jgi:hypothetical protein